MQIRVRLFASLREAAGWGEAVREVPDGITVADLLSALVQEEPRLALAASRTYAAVNYRYAPGETVLHDGDEVALFPPVSGGEVSK